MGLDLIGVRSDEALGIVLLFDDDGRARGVALDGETASILAAELQRCVAELMPGGHVHRVKMVKINPAGSGPDAAILGLDLDGGGAIAFAIPWEQMGGLATAAQEILDRQERPAH